MLYLRKTLSRLAPKLFLRRTQLSPGLNSPLSTPHPHPFQRMWVRSSIAFYGNFNLDMDRSPGFGSTLTDFIALLRLGFPSAPRLYRLTSPASVTRRTVLQKVRGCTHKVLPQLVNTGFQVLFHSPPGVLFTFPSQYYALSVTKEYLALGWGPYFPQGSTSLVALDLAVLVRDFVYGAFTLSGWLSQNHSTIVSSNFCSP